MDQKTSPLLVTLLTIMLSAVITGSIVYGVETTQNNKTKADLQDQLNSLKAQVAALPTTTPVVSASPIVSSTATPSPSATATASP